MKLEKGRTISITFIDNSSQFSTVIIHKWSLETRFVCCNMSPNTMQKKNNTFFNTALNVIEKNQIKLYYYEAGLLTPCVVTQVYPRMQSVNGTVSYLKKNPDSLYYVTLTTELLHLKVLGEDFRISVPRV
jgi:type II secretory pathway component PulC